MTALREVLAQANSPVWVADPTSATLISVRLHGKGAVRRTVGDGKQPKPFRGNRGQPGQFVFSRIWARRGAMALIPAELDGVVVTNEFPLFEIDAARLNPGYFSHVVQTPWFLAELERISAGASGQNRVREAAFLGIDIELPPIEAQRRIAALLDQAEALRAKRRQVLAHLDTLTQSIFHDMFGDPMSVKGDTARERLGSVAHVMTGNSPSRAEQANFGRSIEWIKSGNLGGNVASVANEWLSEQGRRNARIAPAGSILVTCIAGSPASIGKASLVDREVAFNQQINAVLPSADIDAMFLLGQLKVAPGLVRGKSTGGMKGLVSKSAFQSIEILLPPMEAQRDFAVLIARVTSHRATAERALAADDELFAALQARAFRGEL